jgi:hypothetical protein
MRRLIALGALAGLVLFSSAAPAAKADADILRSLHEKVMLAHRQGKASLILEDEAPDYVQANRGEVARPTVEERTSRFRDYLGNTRFEEYRDLVEPVVRVSSDGTLGWVIVQVEARGTQMKPGGGSEPLEFVSAWIELYEKRAGRWYRVGNVSNFKP